MAHTYRSCASGESTSGPGVRVVEFSVKDADTGISEVFALIDPEAHIAEQLARL